MNLLSTIGNFDKCSTILSISRSDQHSKGMISALRLTGLTGAATVDQIAEILRDDFEHSETLQVITAILQEKLVAETSAPPVENYFSKAILCLTVAGHRKIRKASSELAENLIVEVEGGKIRNTAEKALLITESLVEWNREHQIIKYYDARRFTKRQIVKQMKIFAEDNVKSDALDMTSLSDFIEDEGEFTDDYVVALQHRASGTIKIKRCKIAVKQNFETINIEAAARFVWFAASDRQAKKIAELKSQGVILKSVLKPLTKNLWHMLNVKVKQILGAKQDRPAPAELNNTGAAVLRLLKQTNMTLSANEITVLLCKKGDDLKAFYRKVCRARAQLLRMGLLKKRGGKVRPGYNFGRPLQFLYLPENEKFFKKKVFQRQVILGYLYSKKIKEGWRIAKFDPAAPSLTMELDGRRVVLVSDYADGEHNDSVEKTVEGFINLDADKSPRALVMVDCSRHLKVTKRIKKEYIINLCGDFDQYDTAPARRPAR